MEAFVEKIYEDIRKYHMLGEGEHVIAGVSGGADSMCLLYVLHTLAPLLRIQITAVHIHHGLRGEAADADYALAADFCASLGIDCRLFKTDIRKFARTEHLSEEEAGRIYRYQCFEAVRGEIAADKIAVAHHCDDSCETVLLNLFRGSGIKGMTGIAPVRERIIRPLIHVARAEIEKFMAEKKINYCMDATNLETHYMRNRIRNHVLPYVTASVNRNACRHISTASDMLTDVYDFIQEQTRGAYPLCVTEQDGGCTIMLPAYMSLHVVLQREIIRRIIEHLAGRLKDIEQTHIEAIRSLSEKPAGKRIDLPYQLTAVRQYQTIVVRKACAVKEAAADISVVSRAADISAVSRAADISAVSRAADISAVNKEAVDKAAVLQILQIPGEYILPETGRKIQFEIFYRHFIEEIPKNRCTKWFDYDRIKNSLAVRTRQKDDYMTILPDEHRKSLRRIMMDDHIAREDREHIELLAAGSHILWMIGQQRISEYYKVTDETKRILVVNVQGDQDEGKS